MKITVNRNDIIQAVCLMLRIEYSVSITGEIIPIMATIVFEDEDRKPK
jgi:hypothetical protein